MGNSFDPIDIIRSITLYQYDTVSYIIIILCSRGGNF